ncbi:16S rRNA (uracil(1498)-N(3))-methyltransferase [Olivibacter ginsenosidimutans]|uniref:Ribosomal RNA small subunit methyltransferase E n=1 Tax=Olivibacter ginsenosidimutans TaxID=1176537 RepID=A0ABP9ASJ0_9SPHI
MHLFYTPDIATHTDTYTLSEEESKHCVRVLRLTKGAAIALIDGRGNFFHGELIDAQTKHTSVRILSVKSEFGKRNHHLHLVVAPTKQIDRFEWFLEKATEIGVDEITPLICERSERKDIKVERLNKVITAAMKQSLTAYHPKLNDPIKFGDFLVQDRQAQLFIAHCLGEGNKDTLSNLLIPKGNYIVLIGPEGDFSPYEIKLAVEKNYQPITLGDTRLRTETAALYACVEANLVNRHS